MTVSNATSMAALPLKVSEGLELPKTLTKLRLRILYARPELMTKVNGDSAVLPVLCTLR